MEIINPLIAFNLGLFSTLHCLGMCGGIIGALTFSGGAGGETPTVHRAWFAVAYNSGRIISYTLAGAICGFAGQLLVGTAVPGSGHRLLQFAAAAVLVVIGLHLAGWLPRFRQIESLGLKLWQWIRPAAAYFMPVKKVRQALAVGMIWGWLPCALVYSVLLWAVTSGSAVNGAVIMFAFGLGTMPGMVTAGLIGNRLIDIFRNRKYRVWAGVIIICFGIATLFIPTLHHNHVHQQDNSAQHSEHLMH